MATLGARKQGQKAKRGDYLVAVSVHSREEAIAFIKTLSAAQLSEGVLIWSPHRERQVRRERNKRVSFLLWPASLAERATNAITYLKRTYGSDVGIEMACRRLETRHPDEGEME